MTEAISGYNVRLEWLKDELYINLKRCLNDEEIRSLISWYLSYGYSIGLKKEDLINILEIDSNLDTLFKNINDNEVLAGKKPPIFREGDQVEVIVNARNLTYHKGVIREIIWHYNEKKWFYYISENGKKVGKRYTKDDLRFV